MDIEDSAFTNPLYWLNAYGIQALWLPWAVSHGALQDWKHRPVNEADFGDAESRAWALRAFPQLRIDDKPTLR